MDVADVLKSCRTGQVCDLSGRHLYVDSPVRLGPEYDGCVFKGGQTVWDGGRPVSGWQREGRFWVAPLPPSHEFLYRNGTMVPKARYPESGVLHCENWEAEQSRDTYEWARNRMHVSLPESLRRDVANAELVLYFGWQCCRLKGFDVDETGITLPFDTDMYHAPSCDFFFDDMPGEYLAPGQWHPDRERGRIVYCPNEDETPAELDCWSSGAESLILLDGAKDVTFEDITFCHTGDNAIRNSHQGDHLSSAAVVLRGAKRCVFSNCRFQELSCWGADLQAGSTDNSFENCQFSIMGSGAVKMSGGHADEPSSTHCRRNTVVDCKIIHGGLRWAGCVALLIRHAGDNLIADNDISWFPYSGISCGWTWGYEPANADHNRIIRNDIHDLGHDQLVLDMGGIYLLGRQPGTLVAGNHIHHVSGKFFCWGIYLDEGSSDIEIRENLVHDCVNEPFRVHFGRHNRVHDNVFIAEPESACCSITRGTMEKRSTRFIPGDKVFDFSHNLCIAKGMPFFLKYLLDTPGKQDMLDTWAGDYNVCWQLDEACQDKFCDDFHYLKKTYRAIPDDVFITPERDSHSRFFAGKLPSVNDLRQQEIAENLCNIYSRYLRLRQQDKASVSEA